MAYFLRGRKNLMSEEDLEKAEIKKCGHKINLHHVPCHLFNKLLEIIINVTLTRVTIQGCFPQDTRYLSAILQCLFKNSKLEELELDIRCNAFDNACANGVVQLISRGVIKSLQLPAGMTGEQCEEILLEVLTQELPIQILNIGGSVLTDTSMNSLSYLIGNDKVSCLILTKCKGPENSMLTAEHKEYLEKSEKTKKRRFSGKVKIMYFDFVEHLDVDIEELDPSEWEICDLPHPPSYVPSVFGKIGRVAHYMIRRRMEAKWKFVSGRKRRHPDQSETSCKARIQEEDIDVLANSMGKQSIHGRNEEETLSRKEAKSHRSEAQAMPREQRAPLHDPSSVKTTPSASCQAAGNILSHASYPFTPNNFHFNINLDKSPGEKESTGKTKSAFVSAKTANVNVHESKIDVTANTSQKTKPTQIKGKEQNSKGTKKKTWSGRFRSNTRKSKK